MGKYSKKELREIISELLAKGHEGDYWDYKSEWSSSNIDLLKDIICFANTTHSKDCFLIYGADDDGNPCSMHNRKKEKEIIDLIYSYKVRWADNNPPDVALETITLNDSLYDILIVYNTDRTPFYLREDYVQTKNNRSSEKSDESKGVDTEKKTKKLRKGVIYTRTNDCSTGFDRIASPDIVEKLWKKRFHLLIPIYDQFLEEMKCVENWHTNNGEIFYNIYRPEFTFQSVSEEEPTQIKDYYVKGFQDPKAFRNIFLCKYFGTILQKFVLVSVDGSRCFFPMLKTRSIPFSIDCYFYLLKSSEEMVVCHFLNSFLSDSHAKYQTLSKYVPCFVNKEECDNFEHWLQNKKKVFESECATIKKGKAIAYRKRFTDSDIAGIVIARMFDKYKLSI